MKIKKIIIVSLLTYLCPLNSLESFAQKPPSKEYGEGKDIPLVWILDEWHQKHPEIPLFLCICTESNCNTNKNWPFREYNLAEVMPVLGNFNKINAEKIGFSCGEVNKNALQGIGG